MNKATISQLKNHLSGYLKKVKAGQPLLVMDRNQPIARIERLEVGGEADDRIARLERAGLIRRGVRPIDDSSVEEKGPRSKRSVVDALLEERREGR
jgi:antitoxin (DNA-binding transcriptional repressor) of toxin-antitoxin stability system